jgi:hypothetical protein
MDWKPASPCHATGKKIFSLARTTHTSQRSLSAILVKDGGGQKLAYVHYEEEPGRRSAAKLLTKDEARRIAANIAKLPELL